MSAPFTCGSTSFAQTKTPISMKPVRQAVECSMHERLFVLHVVSWLVLNVQLCVAGKSACGCQQRQSSRDSCTAAKRAQSAGLLSHQFLSWCARRCKPACLFVPPRGLSQGSRCRCHEISVAGRGSGKASATLSQKVCIVVRSRVWLIQGSCVC